MQNDVHDGSHFKYFFLPKYSFSCLAEVDFGGHKCSSTLQEVQGSLKYINIVIIDKNKWLIYINIINLKYIHNILIDYQSEIYQYHHQHGWFSIGNTSKYQYIITTNIIIAYLGNLKYFINYEFEIYGPY